MLVGCKDMELLGDTLQGEAIAFVLGGSCKLMRAKSISELINQQRREAGQAEAQVLWRFPHA
jgi:hypothetical protein